MKFIREVDWSKGLICIHDPEYGNQTQDFNFARERLSFKSLSRRVWDSYSLQGIDVGLRNITGWLLDI